MHPELFALLHQERERELETELRRRLVQRERASQPVPRRPGPGLLVRARRAVASRQAAPTVCCATA